MADILDSQQALIIAVQLHPVATLVQFERVPSGPAHPGDEIDLTINIRNDGNTAGDCWVRVLDNDTGALLWGPTKLQMVPEDATRGTIAQNLIMPNKTWNLLCEAGHYDGASLIFDSSMAHIIILILEGYANIITFSGPPSAWPGDPVDLSIEIRNDGDVQDTIWYQIVNSAGTVIYGPSSQLLNVGASIIDNPQLTMPPGQTSDWWIELQTGHVE